MATKPKGGGMLKALVTGPLRKELFLRLPKAPIFPLLVLFLIISKGLKNLAMKMTLRVFLKEKYLSTIKKIIIYFLYPKKQNVIQYSFYNFSTNVNRSSNRHISN